MKVFLEDSFDSAHWLPNVPEGHKCRNLHGHTYRIRMYVTGPLNPPMGWIIDYADVKAAWNAVKARIDHQCLNDVLPFSNTTCENVAVWIWDELKPSLPGLCRIVLRETEHCGVEYEG